MVLGAIAVRCNSHAPGGHPTLPPRQPELWVLVFDPGTGALLGLEFAYCKGPVGGHLATGSCSPASYAQYLEVKAVASIPASPPGPTLSDSGDPGGGTVGSTVRVGGGSS